ncbi:hypothetical protein [Flavobacterium sp.]|uniref:hypothetical protein n=1 Tax=Flavobacterium sp. TaxID=239 RepID=UPI0037532C62
MKTKFIVSLVLFWIFNFGYSQANQDAAILKVLLTKYFKNEKVIVKNRLQYLSLYCNKAPNNEETFEVISKSELLKKNAAIIKQQVANKVEENWNTEIIEIFNNQNQYLKSKVNNCLSLEDYQKVSKRYNDNNQRLMIVSKPMYFETKYCLVKVAFYRNIEHNNSSFLLLENVNGVWIIKEYLNEWST